MSQVRRTLTNNGTTGEIVEVMFTLLLWLHESPIDRNQRKRLISLEWRRGQKEFVTFFVQGEGHD